MKLLFILTILLSLSSCGKPKDQQVADAIDQAQTFLSDGDCDKALKVLEDVGDQTKNGIYLQTLSSVYACKANFDMIDFIAKDIGKIDGASVQDLMTSLSILSLSDETTPDSDTYLAMRKSIEVLLQDGTTAPSQVKREAKYGPRKSGDIGIQVLTYSLVQLGKYLNLYGDVDDAGVKGAGPATSKCFIDYTYATAQTVRVASGGSCNSNTSGNAGLSVSSPNQTTGKRRRCEGLILITNILDVLENLDVSGNDTYKSLSDVGTQMRQVIDVATSSYPSLDTLLETTSQKKCEELLKTQSEADNMELIFALLFETGLQ